MVVTYKDNRLLPAVIITICVIFFYCLLDPYHPANSLDAHQKPPLDYASKLEAPLGGKGDGWNVDAAAAVAADAAKLSHESASTSHSQILSEDVPVSPKTPSEQLSESKPDSHDSSSSGSSPDSSDGLRPEHVVLMVKTGGTTLYKRLLIHLGTSLAPERIPRKSAVIYSDSSEPLGDFSTVDVFANMSASTLAGPDFAVYREQADLAANNFYAEAAGFEGDDWGPPGGWVVDKYKFLPLMRHAGEAFSDARWYVYMEDDAYVFLPNVVAHLARRDHRQPHYLGHYSAKSGVVFAHGGAGFALSRGAWEASFGRKPDLVADWHGYTAEHCCGDQVLGAALNDNGVRFGENDGDEKFTFGFNPVVHWSFAFSRWSWCEPLLSFHKTHARDVAQYYELEKSWNFEKNGPLLHKDFFTRMILPHIQHRREWWDNRAYAFEVNSGNHQDAAMPQDDAGQTAAEPKLWAKSWESADDCEAACESWPACVQWTWVEDQCRVDDKATFGQGYAAGMPQRKTAQRHVSGWLPRRLDAWTCEAP